MIGRSSLSRRLVRLVFFLPHVDPFLQAGNRQSWSGGSPNVTDLFLPSSQNTIQYTGSAHLDPSDPSRRRAHHSQRQVSIADMSAQQDDDDPGSPASDVSSASGTFEAEYDLIRSTMTTADPAEDHEHEHHSGKQAQLDEQQAAARHRLRAVLPGLKCDT